MELKKLDFSGVPYYLLSKQYWSNKNKALAASITQALSGGHGFFYEGAVMNHMTLFFQRGTSYPSHEQTEIGRWDHRDLCHEQFDFSVSDDTYYAWVDPDLWDCDPNCVLYTKEEFMILFEDCCRNYVAIHPERKEEFATALTANGMSLNSSN